MNLEGLYYLCSENESFETSLCSHNLHLGCVICEIDVKDLITFAYFKVMNRPSILCSRNNT